MCVFIISLLFKSFINPPPLKKNKNSFRLINYVLVRDRGVLASQFAVARHLSIQMRFPRSQMRSRSTLVGPNAFPMCSDVLSLDTRRSKFVSYVLTCALARRSSFQMRLLCAQMRSRSTPIDPNAFPACSDARIHNPGT